MGKFDYIAILIRPIEVNDIELRLNNNPRIVGDKVKFNFLAYKTKSIDVRRLLEARAIYSSEILEVIKSTGKSSYGKNTYTCAVKMRLNVKFGEGIEYSLEDYGVMENSKSIDTAYKGAVTDAFKRCCFQLGIGDELYFTKKSSIRIPLSDIDGRNNDEKLKNAGYYKFKVVDAKITKEEVVLKKIACSNKIKYIGE